MENEEALELGKRLVLAMMASASTDKIRPMEWWSRAKSALEVGAQSADSFSSMCSRMARKLCIEVTTEQTAEKIDDVERAIAGRFDPFRRLCATEAVYIVALAQVARKIEREAYAAHPATTDVF